MNLTNPIVLHRIPPYQRLLSNTHSVSCQRKLVQTRPSRAQIIKLELELESHRRSASWNALLGSNQALSTPRAKTGNQKQSGTWTDQATAVWNCWPQTTSDVWLLFFMSVMKDPLDLTVTPTYRAQLRKKRFNNPFSVFPLLLTNEFMYFP